MLKKSTKTNYLVTFILLAQYLFNITSCKDVQINLDKSQERETTDSSILKKFELIEQKISQAKQSIIYKNKVKELNQISQEIKDLKLDYIKPQSSVMFILGPFEAIYSVAKDRDFKHKLLQINNKFNDVLESKTSR